MLGYPIYQNGRLGVVVANENNISTVQFLDASRRRVPDSELADSYFASKSFSCLNEETNDDLTALFEAALQVVPIDADENCFCVNVNGTDISYGRTPELTGIQLKEKFDSIAKHSVPGAFKWLVNTVPRQATAKGNFVGKAPEFPADDFKAAMEILKQFTDMYKEETGERVYLKGSVSKKLKVNDKQCHIMARIGDESFGLVITGGKFMLPAYRENGVFKRYCEGNSSDGYITVPMLKKSLEQAIKKITKGRKSTINVDVSETTQMPSDSKTQFIPDSDNEETPVQEIGWDEFEKAVGKAKADKLFQDAGESFWDANPDASLDNIGVAVLVGDNTEEQAKKLRVISKSEIITVNGESYQIFFVE